MENSTIIAAVIVIVFFVLALVAIFRFDKVKNTFEGLGFKFGISGSRENKEEKTKQGSSKSRGEPASGGKSSIKIGGKVTDSRISSRSSNESEVEIKKDVEGSKIDSKGG